MSRILASAVLAFVLGAGGAFAQGGVPSRDTGVVPGGLPPGTQGTPERTAPSTIRTAPGANLPGYNPGALPTAEECERGWTSASPWSESEFNRACGR